MRFAGHLRANAVAYLALFVALGGTSYATAQLAAGSVGTRELKNNAVVAAKVRDGSLTRKDFSLQLSRALRGQQGVQGPPGAQGPAGAPGAPGAPGAAGPPGPVTCGLPSGVTLRGSYTVQDPAATTTAKASTGVISFGLALAAPPAAHFIRKSTAPPAVCPGSAVDPKAAPGHLCIYEVDTENTNDRNVQAPTLGTAPIPSAARWGAVVYAFPLAAGFMYSWGSWAVTAP